MSWHLQATPLGTVGALLNQIQFLVTDCNRLLQEVAGHRQRCDSCAPTDPTHRDGSGHSMPGAPTRAQEALRLVTVLTTLQSVQRELVICSTEMSHNGMP